MPVSRFLDGFTESGLPCASRSIDLLIRDDDILPSFDTSASRKLIAHGLNTAKEHCPRIAGFLSEYAVSAAIHTLRQADALSAAPLPGYFVFGVMRLLKYEALKNAYPGLFATSEDPGVSFEEVIESPIVEDATLPQFSKTLAARYERLHESFFDENDRRRVLAVLNRDADEGLLALHYENPHLHRATMRVTERVSSSHRELLFGKRSAGLVYALLER